MVEVEGLEGVMEVNVVGEGVVEVDVVVEEQVLVDLVEQDLEEVL